MQDKAPEGTEIDIVGLKAIFARALKELEEISGGKVRDKTMMDTLIPASEVIASYTGDSENDPLADADRVICGPMPANETDRLAFV